MTAATIGNWTIAIGTGSPLSYSGTIEEPFEISGLGQQNDLVDVTSFDSSSKEYIGGLADGQEITVRCNYVPGATNQGAWVSAAAAKTNRSFRVSYVGMSPAKTWTFTGTPISWVLEPSVDNKNVIAFVVKISGAIQVA